MSTVVHLRWDSSSAGPSRNDKQSCVYDAYIPDPLGGRSFMLDGQVAADISDAEAAISRLNAQATSLVDTEALARILLRAESVASSRIEGLQIGARRLLRAEAARELGVSPSDVTALEVLSNIDAMVFGVQSVDAGDPIGVELLHNIHRRLVEGTRLEKYGGTFRDEQNWIGGSDYNPCSATYVPPPPKYVEDMMVDLCAFSSTDDLPAVAQAAIAHAQFETIHPYVDGNGRTGRALIHLILRRRGLAPRIVPPISLILATWAKSYVEGLTAFRYVGEPISSEALTGLNTWVGRFASACTRSVDDATAFEQKALAIETEWRERLGRVRAKSATDLLLRLLVGAPVVNVNSAAKLIDVSFVNTNHAVTRLVEAGILKQITEGKRNRAFEAPEIIAAFTDLERQLASPEGDTKTSKPARGAPQRRQ